MRRRTSDLGFRVGAGEGNRTLMTSLEGWGSAIELRPRCELAAPVAYRVPAVAGARRRSLPPSVLHDRRQMLATIQHRPEQVALLGYPVHHCPDGELVRPQRRVV